MNRTMGLFACASWLTPALLAAAPITYVVTDTGQERCYDDRKEIAYPAAGAAFFGQDAHYQGVANDFATNANGTVTDRSTGLMWTRDPGAKVTCEQAAAGATACRVGGYADWRLPSIKELYSLMDFRGIDPDAKSSDASGLRPFIDARAFVFHYGEASVGDRIIDSQFASSTLYVGTTMGGNKTLFGVNFADGRIKGYPAGAVRDRPAKLYYALYVRGNPQYGKNRFRGNGDGTVTDEATGLTWQQADSGKAMDWQHALAYAEGLALGGHDDWRLPNAKELQSIVDYSRAPDTTGSAAIDPLFACTSITNEAGQKDFGCYWTGTTHVGVRNGGACAAYLSFGRAMGNMRGRWMDVHGAGAQRSDPKGGNPADYAQGRGPQGDAVRVLNYVRCVRGGAAALRASGPAVQAPSPDLSPTRDGPAEGGRPSFVQHLDRNGDGKVSREEFDGPADQFPILDRNHDGFLTEDEAPPPPSGERQRMRMRQN